MAYATRAEVRELEVLNKDAATYVDAQLDEGITFAEARIDQETGTSWEYKAHEVPVDGNGRSEIFVGVPFVRTVTACTVDGAAQVVTGWTGTEDGMVRRSDGGTFPTGSVVVLSFTAGATAAPPDDIAWACRTLARWYVLQLHSRTPSNALQHVSEYGTVTLVQPGGPYQNATALPEVNAVLRRRCHRIPGIA